jgi:formylglycine-generating enzyme required for sulfatase activity
MTMARLSVLAFAMCGLALPVRADAPDGRYKVGAYIVTDNATGLVWQRETDDTQRSWEEAGTYCSKLQIAAGGWRLPTLKELLTLIDAARTASPVIDVDVFKNAKVGLYWSSTTWVTNTTAAWSVDFERGNTAKDHAKTESYYVRCVR